jgi:uncharacterized lipoprotein
MRIVLAVVLLVMAGCGGVNERYARADRATYEAIAPDHEKWLLESDFTPDQKERRLRLLGSWDARSSEGAR